MDSNVKEFLASGKLEMYLYGDLSPTEIDMVESYIANYPEVKNYYNKLENQLERLAVEKAKQTPAQLKERIMASLDGKPKMAKGTQFYRETQYLVALSTILGFTTILALALWAFQYISHQRTFTSLQASLIECNQDQDKIKSLEQQVAFFQDPNTQNIIIKGNSIKPDFSASAQVNKTSSTAFLQLTQIPSLEDEKVIQIWGDIDGVMVPIATLANLTDERMQYSIDPRMENINFTIEDRTADGQGQDHPDVSTLFASSAI